MAKQSGRDQPKGPYLGAAFLCENALTDKDGVHSYIRVIDRVNVTPNEAVTDDTKWATQVKAYLIVMFKSGDATGTHALKVVGWSPAGKKITEYETPFNFEGDEHGCSLTVQLTLIVNEQGIYWFDVLLNSRFVTRIPLRLALKLPVDQRTKTAKPSRKK